MILLSNVIKMTQLLGGSKKIISAKPLPLVESLPLQVEQMDIDEELEIEARKELLVAEVNDLENRLRELQMQLIKDQEDSKAEIARWWEEKQVEANQEAEQLYEEYTKRGFEEGYSQGYQQLQEDFEHKKQEISNVINLAYQEKERLIHEAEPFLLSLSTDIARKIVQAELKQSPEQIIFIVKEGLRQVTEKGEILLQLAPEQLPNILPHIEELNLLVGPQADLKVIPDYTYGGMGCMIHTTNGSYDVTLDNQLKEIKKHLLDYCEERGQ
jgi:flagellar assembly protein FliH